jgi:hypothetical protein
MKKLLGVTNIRDITVSAATAPETGAVADQIAVVLRTRHKIVPGQDDDFTVRTAEEIADIRTQAMGTMTTLLAGIAGNFLCVLVLVTLSSRTRSAIVSHRRNRAEAREVTLVGAGSAAHGDNADENGNVDAPESGRKAARWVKFQRALDRYGVPGVSLLGPLLLPTQFTATMLTASGVAARRVLFWQGLAIIGWTTLLGVVVGGVVHSVA